MSVFLQIKECYGISPTCLEAGKVYKIRLDFRTDRRKESPTASVLIDSIALIPRMNRFPGSWDLQQLRTGFWNFPNCERCDCNGHADTCEPTTGVCSQCRDNTMGDHCEFCINGFYGDPRINTMPMPRTASVNHSFADTCSLDPITRDVICECKAGYAGARCDICSDNYYGNPEVPGGSCRPCECNEKSICLYQGIAIHELENASNVYMIQQHHLR
nr:unnamed protein product [Callosobruchus analis]